MTTPYLTTKPEIASQSRYSARLKTFNSWGSRYPSPEELASAGFFKRESENPDCVSNGFIIFKVTESKKCIILFLKCRLKFLDTKT